MYRSIFIDLDDTVWAFTENARDTFQDMYDKYHFDRYFRSFSHFYTLYSGKNEELWNEYVRISLRWYRCSGELVPRGAEAWYRSYRSDGTGTKRPLHTLSEGAMQTVLQGTLN